MSFIQNLFTSRDNNANSATYVGQQDRIWWDPVTNAFYASNGNTAGGVPVTLPQSSNLTINHLTANSGTIDGNLVVVGNISPATASTVGGIIPGPGVEISNTGLLTINSANLPVSFGDFYASNNILSIVNVDENMILATQGNSSIQLVGNIGFYRTDGPTPGGQFFNAANDGTITIYVPNIGLTGAVNIIGSTTGNEITPGQTGAMMQITGQLSTPCRVYFDGNDNYVSLVGRRWNGNVANPTQVLAGQDILRINATPATDAGVGNTGIAQIRMVALENQTTTAQGSSIIFTLTPMGSPASARVDIANVTVANGVSATQFTTGGLITATGNVTGGNLRTSGTVSATGNITGGNVSGTNLTGTLLTASQPNITSVGTLSSLGVTANITGGNILTAGIVSSTGNITAGNVSGTNIVGTLTTAAQPNITSVGTLTGLSVTGNITSGNVNTANISLSGNVISTLNVTGNINAGNVTNLGTSSVVGNVIGGNIRTTGVVTATGNITSGNILTGGLISATGGITSGASISDNLGSVRSIPQNGQSANYQLQATDNGQMINITSGNITVPAGVFASPFGQTVSIYNNQNSSNAIVQAANVTLRLSGTATTGNRTLARYGLATLVCVAANTFVISGAGLS